jgi:hypothetical protein
MEMELFLFFFSSIFLFLDYNVSIQEFGLSLVARWLTTGSGGVSKVLISRADL